MLKIAKINKMSDGETVYRKFVGTDEYKKYANDLYNGTSFPTIAYICIGIAIVLVIACVVFGFVEYAKYARAEADMRNKEYMNIVESYNSFLTEKGKNGIWSDDDEKTLNELQAKIDAAESKKSTAETMWKWSFITGGILAFIFIIGGLHYESYFKDKLLEADKPRKIAELLAVSTSAQK